MNKRLKTRPILCVTSSSRVSMRTSQHRTRRGYTMVFVCPVAHILGCGKLIAFLRLLQGSYAGARAAHMRVLYPDLVFGAIASSGTPLRFPSFIMRHKLNRIPWLPSGDPCRSYELGIHGRHPACSGPEMFLKPCELDHYHR